MSNSKKQIPKNKFQGNIETHVSLSVSFFLYILSKNHFGF